MERQIAYWKFRHSLHGVSVGVMVGGKITWFPPVMPEATGRAIAAVRDLFAYAAGNSWEFAMADISTDELE